MIIQLETTGVIPIYVQLRNQIVLGIGRGDLKIGEGLPTVRQMAEDIGVNTLTVNKAYGILRQEGYIEIDRRHGAKVSPKVDRAGDFREKMERELELLVAESALKGISREDFLSTCAGLFNQLRLEPVGGTL